MAQKKINDEAEAVQVETVTEHAFTKDQLVKSKRFRDEQDLVSAVLKDGGEYTISETEELIQKYLKGKVN